MEERRLYERRTASIRVEMMHSAFGTLVGFAKDISDGGAQVIMDHGVAPPVGTLVQVKFRRIIGPINQEPVTMRVVYQQSHLLGLSFV